MSDSNLIEMSSGINKAKIRRMSSIDVNAVAASFQTMIITPPPRHRSSIDSGAATAAVASFKNLMKKSKIKQQSSVESNVAATPTINELDQSISRSTSTESISSKVTKNSSSKIKTKIMSTVFVNAAAVAFNNLIGKRTNHTMPSSLIAQAAQRTSDSLMKQFGNIPRKQRIVENFLLVWLHPGMNEEDEIYQQLRVRVQRFINTIVLFTDAEQCIEHLSQIIDEQIFIIVSDLVDPAYVSRIHDMSQVDSIYIICQNRSVDEQSNTSWSKVRSIGTDVFPLADSLQQATQQSDQNGVLLSFVPPNTTALNLIPDHTFLCTQIIRRILLDADTAGEQSMDALASYCHTFYIMNHEQLKNILRFSREYRLHSPVWWYESESFLSSMLNRGFRNLEMDTILKMSFVIRDIHQDIEQAHLEQPTQRSTVYRGQSLPRSAFEHMLQMKGGLMSFHNFLSASRSKDSSMKIARRAAKDPQLVGLIFIITIDASVPFANFHKESNDGVLLSISTVFCIGEIKSIADDPQLWQVKLSVVTDKDPQLGSIMESMDKLIEGTHGWYRLGTLLTSIEEFQKAEQVYAAMIDQTVDDNEKALLYQLIGHLYKKRNVAIQTILYYEKALVIRQRTLPSNHPDLVFSLRDIGKVYDGLGEYSKAVWYYEKAFEIERKILPAKHASLAVACDKIGTICAKISEYAKALVFYEEALQIRQTVVPTNWTDTIESLENIGTLYRTLSDFPKALSFYQRALDIREQHLPQDHPDLVKSYSNIGTVQIFMGKYSKALPFHKKALAIHQKALPAKSLSLAASYGTIALIYHNLGQDSNALVFYEAALAIYEQLLSPQHHILVELYDSIGAVHDKMDQYLKAIEFYEKSLKIRQETLPSNHPELAQCLSNVGSVYYDIGDFATALSLHERAVKIGQSTLSPTHPDLDFYSKCVQATKRRLELLSDKD